VVSGEQGDFETSVRVCTRAVELAPAYAEGWYNLAQACMRLAQYEEAQLAYRKVQALEPDHPHVLTNLGFALFQGGHRDEALECFSRALGRNPADILTLRNLAEFYQEMGEQKLACECLRRVADIEPQQAENWIRLGMSWQQQGEVETALTALRRAQQLDPANREAEIGIAAVLERTGQFDAAWQLVASLLATGVENPVLAGVFGKLSRRFKHTEQGIELLERAIARERQAGSVPPYLHSLAGKLYDAGGEYEQAFAHFREANRLARRRALPDERNRQIDRCIRFFTADFFAGRQLAGSRSEQPVFIVGMPRSGTTLVEQILSSHPAVHGAGERAELNEIAVQLDASPGGYPDCLAAVAPGLLDRLASGYLKQVTGAAGAALRVTDKMPHNFQHLGLIALLFPQARIIHCRRDPLDTCLSIYMSDFNSVHGYATDLQELGHHYLKYRQLMAHWAEVLPMPIFDVRYEDLVQDVEGRSRALVGFCALPWDEACLRFYENRRVVNTISYDQVRVPIYTGSIGRWKHYANWLQPLREVLSGLPA
jgi:tetratricopeptide (TPR) repeat protein